MNKDELTALVKKQYSKTHNTVEYLGLYEKHHCFGLISNDFLTTFEQPFYVLVDEQGELGKIPMPMHHDNYYPNSHFGIIEKKFSFFSRNNLMDSEESDTDNDELLVAHNAKGDGYNPYRDSEGKFTDGLTIAELEELVDKSYNVRKVEAAKAELLKRRKEAGEATKEDEETEARIKKFEKHQKVIEKAKEELAGYVGTDIFKERETGRRPNKYPEDDPKWGTEPGLYTVYRSGHLERNIIFTANDFDGATMYADDFPPEGERFSQYHSQVNSYTVEVTNPFVSSDIYDAYEKLYGKPLKKQLDANSWAKMDEQIMKKIRSKKYDAWTMTNPAPPANKEMVLFGDDGFVPAIRETTSAILPERIAQKLIDAKNQKNSYLTFLYKDGKQNGNMDDYFKWLKEEKAKEEAQEVTV